MGVDVDEWLGWRVGLIMILVCVNIRWFGYFGCLDVLVAWILGVWIFWLFGFLVVWIFWLFGVSGVLDVWSFGCLDIC